MRDNKFEQISRIIEFLVKEYPNQPSLTEVAAKAGFSDTYFQKLFTNWVGISPKKFIQFLSLRYAKSAMVTQKSDNLMTIAESAGLSGTGRLHDLFVTIEAMTPGEYKNEGADLIIEYSYGDTIFGTVLIASTPKGICHLSFNEFNQDGLGDLRARFRNARFNESAKRLHFDAVERINQLQGNNTPLRLHIKGTAFQLKVWQALLQIPSGQLTTYGYLASQIGHEKACRAVGSAVGDNPVAYLIPCHRVIQSTGILGNYRWGVIRKTAMIGWEGAKKGNGLSELNNK